MKTTLSAGVCIDHLRNGWLVLSTDSARIVLDPETIAALAAYLGWPARAIRDNADLREQIAGLRRDIDLLTERERETQQDPWRS